MIISDVSNIGKWSNIDIDVRCDSCGLEKSIKYKLYTSYGYSNGEYLYRKCKLKNNNLEKYGVENVFQLESVKEKSKQTNIEKYGVENVSQSKEISEKIKESISNLDKELINEKRKNTSLEKWGVDNISKLNNIKKSKELTFQKNWGSTNNKKSEDFRKTNFKIAKDENYIKYITNGISIFKCNENHEFEINIDNYIKRKDYNTILYTICNPINRHQSGKEILLFNYIKSIYNKEIIQNYKIERNEIDVYLPELNIGFEFNGLYWHSDKYKDKKFHLDKTKYFS